MKNACCSAGGSATFINSNVSELLKDRYAMPWSATMKARYLYE